jgi:hypothetical protein
MTASNRRFRRQSSALCRRSCIHTRMRPGVPRKASYHMTMLRTSPTPDPGFRRQVCFRVGPDEWPLLEAAVRRHGGIQAALVAALRTHASLLDKPSDPDIGQRNDEPQAPSSLQSADTPPPPTSRKRARQTSVAAVQPTNLVELNLAEAAPLLGVTTATLRRQIKSGRRPGRQGENGYWLARLEVSELQDRDYTLTARGAAEVLALTTATVKRRCLAGRYPGARRGPEGWRVPLGDLI